MRSLRLRLIAFAAIAITVALGAAWYAMGVLFEHYTEQRMADALIDEGVVLQSLVQVDGNGQLSMAQGETDLRFGRLASGLYWQVSDAGSVAASPSLGAKRLRIPDGATTEWRSHEIPGPYEDDLVGVSRRLIVRGSPVVLLVGENDEPLDRARASFSREMGIFLLALGLALAVAAWAQVELGLWPLRRVRRELAEMERNPTGRLSGNHPLEIGGLTRAINALADARSDDLARARRRAGDLAHALKTPLAALAAQSRIARADGAARAADAIDQTLDSATAVVESELARARAAASRAGEGVAVTEPAPLIEALFAVLARTETGMNKVFDADLPDEWRIGVDADSFAEIFGNLLDNAARHARHVVTVSASADRDHIRFEVADDGPGIAPERRVDALRRGSRLDEAEPGHGLGLAIVADLVEATGGDFQLGTAEAGGLAAIVTWPRTILQSPIR